MSDNIEIAPFCSEDHSQWLPLWDGNNMGQGTKEVTTKTWQRLVDPDASVYGLAAKVNGEMVGILHYILHPTTGNIDPVCYMQDVYVAPEQRQKGIGRALVERLSELGKEENWARLYWLAETNNEAAQALYRSLGIKLNFSLHIMPL